MKLLLDTNFLLIPGQFKVDVFTELQQFGKPELFTLNLVIKELESLGSRHSRLALQLVEKQKITILNARGETDDAIVRVSQTGYTVCTQDRVLAKRLHARHTPVITLRQKRTLILKEKW